MKIMEYHGVFLSGVRIPWFHPPASGIDQLMVKTFSLQIFLLRQESLPRTEFIAEFIAIPQM
jgi:hypothetical protein